MATPLAGDLLDVDDVFDWRTWTPTWNNLTLGAGATNEGRWVQIGPVVLWQLTVTLGTSPSFAATIAFDLPVTAWVGAGLQLQSCIGSWIYRDSSVPAHFDGSVGIFNSAGTQASFAGAWSGTAPNQRIGQGTGVPATPASGDVLSASGQYFTS